MKQCIVCHKEIPDNRIVCSLSCRGRWAGIAPRTRTIKPKEAKLNKQGYLYYSKSMLTDDELTLLPGSNNIILVHRLVAAKHHNRPIKSNEQVMHIDGNKTNNDPANLCIGEASTNKRQHYDALIEYNQARSLAAWVLLALGRGTA